MYRHLILLTLLLNLTSSHAPDPVALRFGYDLQSYILINPDMTPLEDALSICSWVNKLQGGSAPTWIRYNAPSADRTEFSIRAILHHTHMLQDTISHSVTSVTMNEWHHVCLTWSYSTRTKILYYDGNKVGSKATPSGRKLATGGTIAIGQSHKTSTMEASFYSGYSFGGELLKLNIFTRQLTEDEVSEMYNSGKCSNFEESLAEDTFLSWETLVNHTTKHGNIVKVDPTCPSHSHEEPTEIPTESERTVEINNSWEILFLSEYHNKVVTSDLLENLKSKFEILAEFIGHRIDDNLINHLVKHH